jgi:glycosidase
MEDFVFGGIEADPAERLAGALARGAGIRHLYQITPRDPLPGEPVTVTVFVGPDVLVDRLTLYWTNDGSDPAGGTGIAVNGAALPLQQTAVRWEPLLWDYVAVWEGVLPGQPAGTLVHYRIEGWRSYDPPTAHWSHEPHIDGSVEHATLYGYHVDDFTLPAWAQSSVVYQIFVDRFAGFSAPATPDPWLAPERMNDFYGGTLRGVIDRLEYLADLGVTALWLTPIFHTASYHGYDTTDYYTVDPRFGTNDDLRALVGAAHARGLRVILDFVANHTSTEFVPFATALADSASPYRAWFGFDAAHPHGYRTFFNVASMPQFNTDHPAARRYLIDAARFWLSEYAVDGYRLDYAAGPSLSFWSEFRAACRAARPDCWLFGEVTHAGDEIRAYAGRLDGCLDFALCRLLRQLCAGPRATIPLRHFVNNIERSQHFFDGLTTAPATFSLPSFLDNHDMNRFLWAAGNDQGRLRMAATILFALGGPPILYYGTEVGLSQPRTKGPWREEARHPMPWGAAQDQALLAFFKTLIAFRRHHSALQHGTLRTVRLDEAKGLWLAERTTDTDQVLLAVNAGETEQRVPLPAGDWYTLNQQPAGEAITVAARSAMVLAAHR